MELVVILTFTALLVIGAIHLYLQTERLEERGDQEALTRLKQVQEIRERLDLVEDKLRGLDADVYMGLYGDKDAPETTDGEEMSKLSQIIDILRRK